jgi:hypothetical protein
VGPSQPRVVNRLGPASVLLAVRPHAYRMDVARGRDGRDWQVQRLRTDRRTVGILAALAAVGVVFLLAGERNSDANHPYWRAILLSLGGLFVASATLSFVWELAGKRLFAQEVLAAAGVAADVRRAGLRAISGDYLDVADWPELFRNATEIDLFASWAATWRRTHERHWIEWIERPNVKLRVLLPDSEDRDLLEHLAHRFSKDPSYVNDRIHETAEFYQGLHATAGEGTTVEVRFITRAPVWGYYRMGATVVATLYPNALSSAPWVPAMVLADRGETGQFFRSQFDLCWGESQEARTKEQK